MIRKTQILESLHSMDQAQMEKVLRYVKTILEKPAETDYERFRKNALKEIREALRKG